MKHPPSLCPVFHPDQYLDNHWANLLRFWNVLIKITENANNNVIRLQPDWLKGFWWLFQEPFKEFCSYLQHSFLLDTPRTNMFHLFIHSEQYLLSQYMDWPKMSWSLFYEIMNRFTLYLHPRLINGDP